MLASLFDPGFQRIYDQAVAFAGTPEGPYPSPADWRDGWIYFLLVDRFNAEAAPAHQPYDDARFDGYQGGKFSGIGDKLGYIKALGASAIWLSPVLKNLPFDQHSYHGYGIHDFLHAEPRFADNPDRADDELRALVDAAHAHGLVVIFDIVLNHTGNVFSYRCNTDDAVCVANGGSEASFHDQSQVVEWRDANGAPQQGWTDVATINDPPGDALVWPEELQRNEYFRRQGRMPAPGDDTVGDFESLKQMLTDNADLQRFLIRAYQYVIARYDVDGFRIDTLRYLKGNMAQLFGNAIREYALSIGKKNFFTFGEIWTGDAEETIAHFIGRHTNDSGDLVGVDAALDYPLYNYLKPVVKGFAPPSDLVGMFRRRKEIEKDILSSHGDATRFFVTFLDNHDVKERFRYMDPLHQAAQDDEVSTGVACLLALPGIPCLYYGTEQGLHGAGSDPAVREALWGISNFDQNASFYGAISSMSAVRANQPALRYGRFYFRPVSGDRRNFGISSVVGGVLAFSRILNDAEVVVVANTSKAQSQSLHVIVDAVLNPRGKPVALLYSNKNAPSPPGPVEQLQNTTVNEVDGSISRGTLHAVQVALQPMEVQLIR